VTGAGGGIGAAIARRFADEGALVYALDRPDTQAAEGDRIATVFCNLQDRGQIENFFGRLRAETGWLDVLVNNAAAITRRASVSDLSPEEWNVAVAVNLTAAFLMCRHAIPLMRQGASIINVASQLGHVSTPGRAAYSATKGGLIAFTKGLALDCAEAGIRVNSLSPGAVQTGRLVAGYGSAEAAHAALRPLHPIGRLGQADEIAEAALFLAGPRSSFMTGSDLLVDGGYCAR
jgi:NAD(P)-dependent dehydrogenase (short-subunit alcohol dehydrogenase family)